MERFLYQLTMAWLTLFVSVVWVLTFGFYRPQWDVDYAVWNGERRIKKEIMNAGFRTITSVREEIIDDVELANRAHSCDKKKRHGSRETL